MTTLLKIPPRSTLAHDHAVELADLFHLLGDPSRLRIVFEVLDRPLAVGDIAARLDLSASLVSHHLRLLRAARIVAAERSGKHVFYIAADDHVRRIIRDMLAHRAEPPAEDD